MTKQEVDNALKDIADVFEYQRAEIARLTHQLSQYDILITSSRDERDMNIEKRIAKSRKKISDGLAEIALIQSECNHPNLEGRYCSNTGNYCEQDDSYWLDLSCPTCGKKWSVDSEQPEYRLYGDQSWQKFKCKIIK